MATAALAGLGLCAATVLGGLADVSVFALSVTTAAVPMTAGYLAIRHEPDNWVGACLTAAGTGIILIIAHGQWQEALAAEPRSLPASPVLWVLTQGVWMAWFVPYALTIALFPDGRPHGRPGRFAVAALLGIPPLFNLLTAFVPGPLMPPLAHWPRALGTHPVGYLSLALLPLFLAALAASVVSLARRRSAADSPARRAQLRWMLLASAVVPITLLLCWLGYLVTGGPGLVIVGLVAMNVLVPAGALLAMLRYDLYDVDKALVLTAAYTLLAVFVLVGYAGVSAVVGRALGADSVAAGVTATVAVMLLLLPVRAMLLRLLGRRLHPRRAAGLDALTALAERVNAGTDVPERLEEVLRVALRDPGLRVGYRRPGGTAYVDITGAQVDSSDGQMIGSSGRDVGLVVAGPGAAPVPPDVVAAMTLLADSVRLRGELAGALAEVEASRARLLKAGYAERRKLEMNLHDGAQQRLVSLGMRLRTTQHKARTGHEVDLDALVNSAVEELADAVHELRALARGLRPSSLDAGLPAALDSLTRASAVPVEVTYAAPGLPDHVSLTAYYVVSEAITNAVKHAQASRVSVDVRHTDEALRVLVRDNGNGRARVVAGSGLAGLRDRVSALGGSLDVTSSAATGTHVEAVIPCRS